MYEGKMFRMTDNESGSKNLKVYYYRLVGKELYVYKKENSHNHNGMHNLAGVFLRDVTEEEKFDKKPLYSFKLIYP